MRVSHKDLAKLVKVVKYDTSDVLIDCIGESWAIPCHVENWIDFIDVSVYSPSKYVYFIPSGTLGTIIQIAEPVRNVGINYAKVLFPEAMYDDPHNTYLSWSKVAVFPAGAYWISGDFLEEINLD
jgi:hypothetical protein